MPSRNIVKRYADEQFYHVYSRGIAKQELFVEDNDYAVFLSLLKRYLSNQPARSPARLNYPWYQPRLELVAFCLMPNHIHLLFYQHDAKALPEFMRSLMTSYSMYFNCRHKRQGPVFQSRYLASPVSQDNYLEHISRYIHLNPKGWKTYPYSSLAYFMKRKSAEWIKPERVLQLFANTQDYFDFVPDHLASKNMIILFQPPIASPSPTQKKHNQSARGRTSSRSSGCRTSRQLNTLVIC